MVISLFGSPDAFVLDQQDQVVASEGHWVWADEREGHGPVEIRAEAEAGPLAPLYGGRAEEAQAWSADVGGLRFVGIDNSHYQVTPEQTRVLQTALELQPEEGQEVSSSQPAGATIPGSHHNPREAAAVLTASGGAGSVRGNSDGAHPSLDPRAPCLHGGRRRPH